MSKFLKLLGAGGGAAAPSGDPHWANVLLLVRASTTSDLSPVGRTLTWGGSVTTDGDEIVFPGTDSTGSGVITAPDAADLTFTSNFCIEVFGAKFNSVATIHEILSHWRPATGGRSWGVQFRGDLSPKQLNFVTSADGTAAVARGDDFTPTAGQAYDICIEQTGTDLRVYVDGAMIHKETWTVSLNNSMARLVIGAIEGGDGTVSTTNEHIGRAKEYRITKAARYSSDGGYTVPSLPLPTS